MTDPFITRLSSALADRYELDHELIGGGMSRVFVANEKALGRKVVVKVLPPDLSAGVNAERFRREIQLAAQLQHPHIVPLLSAGQQDDLLYYTMPYIEGESLRHRIERDGALPVRDVIRILHDVVEALAYAHDRGVIHRDIKPGNILALGAHALVTDFGVAKALSAALPHSGTTSAGMVVGSPAYMAPEQLAGDPSADHRVDIYAAGLLAYELLSGSSPFTGTTPQETMAAQLTRTPEPLHRLRDDVPVELSAVIERALRKAPEQRQPTARAMLEELEQCSTPQGAVLTGAAAPSAARSSSGRTVLFVGILLVAGSAAAAALLSARRGQHNDAAAPAADSSAVAGVADSTPAAAAGAPKDSIIAIGDTSRPGPVTGPQAPVVLSYADSVAIARAIQRRSGSPVNADSLKAIFQRALSDSAVVAAQEISRQAGEIQAQLWAQDLDRRILIAPQLPPAPAEQPRVVIADIVDGTPGRWLGARAAELSDSLRSALDASTSLEIVSGQLTREVTNRVKNRAAAGWTLRADLIITGHAYASRGDDAQRMVIRLLISDLRTGRVRTVTSSRVAPDDPLAVLPSLVETLGPNVESMATASRSARARTRVQVTPPVPPVARPMP